jgi:hypothetical protein
MTRLPSTTHAREPQDALTPQEHKALLCLLEAHRNAIRLNCNAWQFALELHNFERQGITSTVLRCLVQQGLAAHGKEKTRLDAPHRTVRCVRNLHFTEQSCFVLTRTGAGLADALIRTDDNWVRAPHVPGQLQNHGQKSIPSFVTCDDGHRELRVFGQVVKRFAAYAEHQETILGAFEQQSWVHWIADPLHRTSGQNPKTRLRDAIARLNRHQVQRLIQFHGDGNGRGLRWELLAEPNNSNATATQQPSC